MTEQAPAPTWRTVARELALLPRAEQIIVFGSVAKGCDGPYSDIDCLMPDGDVRALAIAKRHYGLFDPFYTERGFLMTRNDWATGWDFANKTRSILRAIARDGVPLAQIIERIRP